MLLDIGEFLTSEKVSGVVPSFSGVGPSFSGAGPSSGLLIVGPSCSELALPSVSWPFLGGLALSWGFDPSFSGVGPSFSGVGLLKVSGLLGVGASRSGFGPSFLGVGPFSRICFFGEVGPSFSGFGSSLSLTPKVFFLNHFFNQ